MPEVLPTINNEPAQGIQALLDTVYLWNPDVANDLIERVNELLEQLNPAMGTISPYSQLEAPVVQYTPCYNGDNVYVAAEDLETLPTTFNPAQWILIATKAPTLQAGTGIEIQGNEISVTQEISGGAAAGATAVQPGDLATVATSGSYTDLSNTPAIPAVIDNYNSTSGTSALSANMGHDLNERLSSVEGRGRYLSTWDCATGLAGTNPPESPYTYKSGDYFIVSVVGATNYKPSGSQYVIGTASSTVETNPVAVNDTYQYDGTNWTLLKNTVDDPLPAQAGNAGKFLTTDGSAVSWSDKPLQNTATGMSSLSILGTGTQKIYATNIGAASKANANMTTAVGYGAVANGLNSVQIGMGTNNDANTFKVHNNNGNYEIMSADGSIPSDRLTHAIRKLSTMPTASADYVGQSVQFDGTTDATYTHGYIYECVSDGQNPATYSWAQTNVQPAPSGLPDQTGQSGKFLTTDGTDASWSDKPLVNTSEVGIGVGLNSSAGTRGVAVGASADASYECVAIGYQASGQSNYGIAIGRSATASNNGIAVGYAALVNSGRGIAIGNGARSTATGAVQIGVVGGNGADNADPNTFKWANEYGNFQVIDTDGSINWDRIKTKTVTGLATLTGAPAYEGVIVQYNGATDANYTNGYFYKCSSSVVTPSSAAVNTGATTVNPADITIDLSTLESKLTAKHVSLDSDFGVYFTWYQSINRWAAATTYGYIEAIANTSTYGVTYSGTPADGDTIYIDYTAVVKAYVWTQTDVQPAGTTYTAGNGIGINANNEISVADPVLVNNSTSGVSRLAVGSGASAAQNTAQAFGTNAHANSNGSLAVGYNVQAQGNYSTAINGSTGALRAIQLGYGSTNSDANTFKVGNANGNYEIMSADGTIPADRLTHAINKYSTMPTAASTNEGWIVQFTGTTDSTYTHGHLYECVSDGADPATYSWTEVQLGGGGGLQNTATGTESLTVLGTATTENYAVNIGVLSQATGQQATAVGRNAIANRNSIAIGCDSRAGSYSTAIGGTALGTSWLDPRIAIGRNAVSGAAYAIQIGADQVSSSTNSDSKTVKIYNGNGNFEIMSADGTIPEARLADTTNAAQGQVLTLDSNLNAVWQASSGGGSVPTLTWYTVSSAGTTLTIADTSSASLVKVYKNGLLLQPTEDYTISGTTLTTVAALVVGDKITTEVF